MTLKKLLGEKDLQITILEDLFLKNPTISDKVEIANKWITRYTKIIVLRILGLNRFTYYYQQSRVNTDKKTAPGRNIPRFSYSESGKIIPDEQVQAHIVQIIEEDGSAYGYL